MSLAFLGPPTENRRIVDDDPAAIGIEILHLGAHATEGAIQRDIEDKAPLIVRHVDNRNLSAKAGIIDENIDATERCSCTFDKRLHVAFYGHVTRNTDNTKFRG